MPPVCSDLYSLAIVPVPSTQISSGTRFFAVIKSSTRTLIAEWILCFCPCEKEGYRCAMADVLISVYSVLTSWDNQKNISIS